MQGYAQADSQRGTTSAYIECQCSFSGHAIKFEVSDEGNFEPDISVSLQLSRGGFFYRLRNAIHYLFFGEQPQWVDTLLNAQSVEKIEHVFLDFKRRHRAWKLRLEGKCLLCEGQGGVSKCNECGKCAFCKQINVHDDGCKWARGNKFVGKTPKPWSDYEL